MHEDNNESSILKEIESQYNAWIDSLEEYKKNSNNIKKLLSNHNNLYFIGCGSSYHCGLISSYAYNYLLSKKSFCFLSSDVLTYPDKIITQSNKNDLYLLISRTGKTGETLLASHSLKKIKGKTISIATFPNSELAKNCDYEIVLEHCQEKSITATKSMTAITVFLLKTIFEYSNKGFNDKDFLKKSERIFQKIEDHKRFIKSIIDENCFYKFIFLGTIPFNGLVKESELKVKEMSITDTESNNPLEFRHGHKAILSKNSLVILFLSDGGYEYEIKVAKEFKEIGAKVLLIGNSNKLEGKENLFDYLINIEFELEEICFSVIYVLFSQLIGYFQALKKELDPSIPKNLDYFVNI